MGAEICVAAQAALGEPLISATEISAADGFRLWADCYDETPNPLLALEMRLLAEKNLITPGMRVLDAGSGTGRWMSRAQRRGAHVFGIDACHEMVLRAERKTGLRGRSAIADICSIPLGDGAVDLAICSFTLGYVSRPAASLQELARVSQHIIVSDLHPDAVCAGWSRSFRSGHQRYELAHFNHHVDELDRCAGETGLDRVWRIEASFGEPERELFARGGKTDAFDEACSVRAVLITLWQKRSD